MIKGDPTKPFALVNELKAWEQWSPWARLDPAMKQSYDGPSAGSGSKYHWTGNSEVGEGNMTIIESLTNSSVRISLEFIKPFASKNVTEFRFTPEGSNTKVEWVMTGKNDFMGKTFDLFVNLDKTVGSDFEKGLSQLKSLSEMLSTK